MSLALVHQFDRTLQLKDVLYPYRPSLKEFKEDQAFQLSNVPTYLRCGSLYQIYVDAAKECESNGEEFTIPDIPHDKRKAYPTVNNCADLEHLLKTLSYWAVNESNLPETVVPFCQSTPESNVAAEVLRQFQVNFPRLAQLADIITADSAQARCVEAAKHGRTDMFDLLISTARASADLRFSSKVITFSAEVMETATQYGKLDFLRDMVVRKLSLTRRCLAVAAGNGHMHVLQYLHEGKGIAPEKGIAIEAAEAGQLSCLVYVHERTGLWDKYVTAAAAGAGQLHVLQYAQEKGLPVDGTALLAAREGSHTACVEYLHFLGIS
jgi:hypothetical protein